MIEKVGHIRNPLSIIAIFAGIAEISGTIVLPFLQNDIQSIYVYFLMLFPSALVVMFFGTLWFRHQVLYAPSDYKDENNFAKWVKFASVAEVVHKKEQENIEDDEKAESSFSTIDGRTSKENVRQNDNSNQTILRRAFAEELAFNKLSDMYPDLVRNIKLGSPDERGIVLDGAILKGQPTFIDVRTPFKLTKAYIRITSSKFIDRLKPQIPDDARMPKLLMVYVAMNDEIDKSLPKNITINGALIDLMYFKYSDLNNQYRGSELF